MLTDYIVAKHASDLSNMLFQGDRERTIVMIYCPLVELGLEVIGNYFDWPSGVPISWTFDADSLDMRRGNGGARDSRPTRCGWASSVGGSTAMGRTTTLE